MHRRCIHIAAAALPPVADRATYEAKRDFLLNGGTTEEWEKLETKKAIYNYMSAQSYVINEKLRKNTKLSEDDEKFVADLDKALKKMLTYEGNLQRSLLFYSDDDIPLFMKDYVVGEAVTYKEYLSTTNGDPYNPDGKVQIYIQDAKKGRDITSLNEWESEVLYERNSSFMVRKIMENEGKIYILLEEYDE